MPKFGAVSNVCYYPSVGSTFGGLVGGGLGFGLARLMGHNLFFEDQTVPVPSVKIDKLGFGLTIGGLLLGAYVGHKKHCAGRPTELSPYYPLYLMGSLALSSVARRQSQPSFSHEGKHFPTSDPTSPQNGGNGP